MVSVAMVSVAMVSVAIVSVAMVSVAIVSVAIASTWHVPGQVPGERCQGLGQLRLTHGRRNRLDPPQQAQHLVGVRVRVRVRIRVRIMVRVRARVNIWIDLEAVRHGAACAGVVTR